MNNFWMGNQCVVSSIVASIGISLKTSVPFHEYYNWPAFIFGPFLHLLIIQLIPSFSFLSFFFLFSFFPPFFKPFPSFSAKLFFCSMIVNFFRSWWRRSTPCWPPTVQFNTSSSGKKFRYEKKRWASYSKGMGDYPGGRGRPPAQ